MRYIKKFESSGEELDFDTFKDIMLDVTDMVDSSESKEYLFEPGISNDVENFYSCELSVLFSSIKFIECNEFIEGPLVPTAEEPESLSTAKLVIKDTISDIEDKLYDIKNKVDGVIETNKKVLEIINHIDKYIVPRFESFKNYKDCMVGIDYTEEYINQNFIKSFIKITVTFELI